jgi:hypothetical protein
MPTYVVERLDFLICFYLRIYVDASSELNGNVFSAETRGRMHKTKMTTFFFQSFIFSAAKQFPVFGEPLWLSGKVVKMRK